MAKFTQKDVEDIGNLIFGETKYPNDYTVFEFLEMVDDAAYVTLNGQIYRYSFAEDYRDISIIYKIAYYPKALLQWLKDNNYGEVHEFNNYYVVIRKR